MNGLLVITGRLTIFAAGFHPVLKFNPLPFRCFNNIACFKADVIFSGGRMYFINKLHIDDLRAVCPEEDILI